MKKSHPRVGGRRLKPPSTPQEVDGDLFCEFVAAMATAMAESLYSFHSLCRPATIVPSASNSFIERSSFFHSKRILSNCKLVAACRSTKLQVPKVLPDALLFDCDGVLVDTERDGHRVCFNKAFEEQGVAVNWDVEFFGTILDVGIGKERIAHYFDAVGWPPETVDFSESQREDFVAGLHKRKTAFFIDMVESGQLPLRPGVTTLIDEALANGVKVCELLHSDKYKSFELSNPL